MKRIDLVNLILGRLGGRTGTTVTNQVVQELQFRQSVLEHEATLPWFLLGEASLVIAGEEVPLPVDFLREYEDDNLFVRTGSGAWTGLIKAIPGHIFADEDVHGMGRPCVYYLTTELHVFPTPGEIMQGRIFYYQAQPVLVDDLSENQWTLFGQDLLAAEAGYTTALFLRDFNAAQLFEAAIGDARRRIVTEGVARKQAAYSAMLGSRS
jgi:hypothetical protein